MKKIQKLTLFIVGGATALSMLFLHWSVPISDPPKQSTFIASELHSQLAMASLYDLGTIANDDGDTICTDSTGSGECDPPGTGTQE